MGVNLARWHPINTSYKCARDSRQEILVFRTSAESVIVLLVLAKQSLLTEGLLLSLTAQESYTHGLALQTHTKNAFPLLGLNPLGKKIHRNSQEEF